MADLNAVPARKGRELSGEWGNVTAAHFTYTFAAGQIADVADARFDDVIVAKKAANSLGFGRRFNDNELLTHSGRVWPEDKASDDSALYPSSRQKQMRKIVGLLLT